METVNNHISFLASVGIYQNQDQHVTYQQSNLENPKSNDNAIMLTQIQFKCPFSQSLSLSHLLGLAGLFFKRHKLLFTAIVHSAHSFDESH